VQATIKFARDVLPMLSDLSTTEPTNQELMERTVRRVRLVMGRTSDARAWHERWGWGVKQRRWGVGGGSHGEG
jgi:hypothetical protein